MKKTGLLTIPLALMFLFGLVMGNYAEVGQWLYKNAMSVESSIAGLEAKEANVGEMEMAYYIHANPGKPTLLMLHGFSSNKDIWNRFAKHFANDYQIIVPDLAGHGATPYNKSWSYSMPAQAKRVVALLNAVGVEKVHIIGNSMGGFLTATLEIGRAHV